MNKKLPPLKAIFNFIFLGSGYLYFGKRKSVGWIMLLTAIAMTMGFFMDTLGHFSELANTQTPSLTLIILVVTVDRYLLVKETNEKNKQ